RPFKGVELGGKIYIITESGELRVIIPGVVSVINSEGVYVGYPSDITASSYASPYGRIYVAHPDLDTVSGITPPDEINMFYRTNNISVGIGPIRIAFDSAANIIY